MPAHLLKPDEIKTFDRNLRTLRKALKKARKDEEPASVIDGLKASIRREKDRRKDLKKKRRAERREAGDAWDQRFGKAVAGIVDEKRAKALIAAELEDVAEDIARDDFNVPDLVERLLTVLEEEADHLVDFSDLPGGVILELLDDVVFRWAVRQLRPLVEAEVDKAVAKARG